MSTNDEQIQLDIVRCSRAAPFFQEGWKMWPPVVQTCLKCACPCRGHGNMQVEEIWHHSRAHGALPPPRCGSWSICSNVEEASQPSFYTPPADLNCHIMLFIESPLLSLLHLPTYGSFFLQNPPPLLLLFCLSLSYISHPSLFFPPSMRLQPFSHPTSNQPYSAFRWSSDGPQVAFYLSVHEAPFLHLHLPTPPHLQHVWAPAWRCSHLAPLPPVLRCIYFFFLQTIKYIHQTCR